MNKAISATPHALDLAREVISIEAAAVYALIERIDGSFLNALDIILSCHGRVIVSGMGKSGHIARKIAATLSSTGTPAYFVHPAEASHGDLGMITSDDVFVALSYSGESEELLTIVPVIKRQGVDIGRSQIGHAQRGGLRQPQRRLGQRHDRRGGGRHIRQAAAIGEA